MNAKHITNLNVFLRQEKHKLNAPVREKR
uniref:Uncharacterized protein n=1 Tax=Rhizophora mucronata TaxID=61149 RepID=A0A2P2ITC7_RHIMU